MSFTGCFQMANWCVTLCREKGRRRCCRRLAGRCFVVFRAFGCLAVAGSILLSSVVANGQTLGDGKEIGVTAAPTEGGQAQMLFIDESAFTVGPNSEVVLDEFVFDPDTGTGRLALTATKGVFRFVGGKISKKSPVTLKTPTAVIGIRGGIALVNVQPGGATQATFLFGDQMTVAAGGVTQVATRPGFAITAPSADEAPTPPAPAPPAQLNAALNSLERSTPPADDGDGPSGGDATQQGGSQGQGGNQQQADGQQQGDSQQQGEGQQQGAGEGGTGQQVPTDQDVAETSIGAQGSQQAPRAFSSPIVLALARRAVTAGVSDSGGPQPTDTVSQAQQNNTLQENLQPTDTVSQAQQNNTLQENLQPSATNLSGRLKRSFSRLVGTADQTATSNIAFSGGSLGSGVFSAPIGSNTFKFPVAGIGTSGVGSSTATASPNGTFSGNVFLSANTQFLFLEGIETANTTTRVVGFAGKPSSSIPTTGASFYALQDDFGLNSTVPFLRQPDVAGITVPEAEGAADAAIYWDISGSSTAQRSFGFRTISITGQGTSQKSVISLGGGRVLLDSQNRPFISGGAIAMARQSVSGLPTITDSDLSTADDGLGNDFFGPSGSHFVLESAQVNLSDTTLTNTGAKRFNPGGATQTTSFFPTVVALPATSTLATRSTRTMGGYLGGAYQNEVSGSLLTTTMFQGQNGNSFDALLKTNAAANKVQGTFKFTNAFGSGPAFQVNFGDKDSAFGDGSTTGGDSIFIDDTFITAGDQDGGGSVTINSVAQNDSSIAFVSVSSSTEFSSGFLPSGVSTCACKYLNWGFWGGKVANSSTSSSEMIHLANYVVGEIAGFAAINALQGTATYSGHAIGTVFTSSQVYQAIGGLSATVNFDNTSASTFNISNFDGANYSGTGLAITADGTRHKFSGSISGAGRTGGYTGSFMSGGGDVAAEMGGQFKVDGGGYSAVGVFAAAK